MLLLVLLILTVVNFMKLCRLVCLLALKTVMFLSLLMPVDKLTMINISTAVAVVIDINIVLHM